MKQRGECCVARRSCNDHDVSKMDRIMLKFRPIAPKPATSPNSGISASLSSGSGSSLENSGPTSFKTINGHRGKRKVCNNNNNNNNSNKKSCRCSRRRSNPLSEDSVKTLPLLPEVPEVKETPKTTLLKQRRFPLWLSFENHAVKEDPTVGIKRRVVVGSSCVSVECVTDTWPMVDDSRHTDQARVMSLDRDTCPGFVTDGLNNVRWTNAAYRRMVAGDEGGEVVVTVVVKEGVSLPVGCTAAFTCRVRVVTCRRNEKSWYQTVPCDVWKMDCGGFAWRLDTDVALSLGR